VTDRYARTVFGFHGTDPPFAARLIRGDVSLADWFPSSNEYDWLGHGIYFWEYAPDRARAWASKGGVRCEMGEPLRTEELRGIFRNMTSEESDEIIAAMIRDGILDADGNVLKRFPEPPDWLTQGNGRPAPSKPEKPAKPTKKRPPKSP
jgi:hypothetical protein